ncbi:hypothetical protein OHB10_21930 [Streptomyces sp. NBC_01597]|uniref:DUF6801 domain-containing protein n=1 Tax=Streptomyces sp. NBC_01597 TaxID=2975891 RepID=UPI00386AE955
MAVALLGSAGFLGAGSATAAPAPRSLTYSCAFPFIGDKPMKASVTWTAARTYVAGRAAPRSPVDAPAAVGGNVSQSLRMVGAATVEGSADVHAVVAAPGGDIPVTLTFDVPRTAIPQSGPLSVDASGSLPSLTFARAGRAKLVFGGIDLHLTPRDSGGGTPVGRIDAPCHLNSGQDGVVGTFTIQPTAGEPTAPGRSKTSQGPGRSPRGDGSADDSANGSGRAGSGRVSGQGSGQESGSASDSASASVSASVSAQGAASAGAPGGTSAASRPGAPGTASPAAAEADGTGAVGPLRVLAVSLAVGAGVLGCGWWGLRRIRARGR